MDYQYPDHAGQMVRPNFGQELVVTGRGVESCSYKLDFHDQIVDVDQGWIRFAEEAGAKELLPERVLHRSLWLYVADARMRLLQGAILRNVRTSRIPLVLPFRCDAPELQRWMEMSLTAHSDRSVTIATRVLRSEPRRAPAFLYASRSRAGGEIVAVCNWCNEVKGADGPWRSVESLLQSRPGWPVANDRMEIRHSLCPCCDAVLAKTAV